MIYGHTVILYLQMRDWDRLRKYVDILYPKQIPMRAQKNMISFANISRAPIILDHQV